MSKKELRKRIRDILEGYANDVTGINATIYFTQDGAVDAIMYLINMVNKHGKD